MSILRIYGIIGLVILTMGLASPSRADNLQHVCNEMYAKLETIKGAALGRREGFISQTNIGLYEYRVPGATHYYGCILILNGNDKDVKNNKNIDSLFDGFDPNGDLYQQGWRDNQSEDADGPDGGTFELVKGDIVCQFVGMWDGGDDSNPKYIPSPLFEYDVACGKKVP